MFQRLKCRIRRRHTIVCAKSFDLDSQTTTHVHQCMKCKKTWEFEAEPLPESFLAVLKGIERAKQRGIEYSPTPSEIQHARKDLLN